MRLYSLIITIFSSFILLSQKVPDVSVEMLEQQHHPLDASAHAAHLFQKVEIEYKEHHGAGFVMELDYHFRTKVYDEKGASYASFEIPLYRSGSDREMILDISGYSYNLENGKLQSQKLSKKDIFDDKASENYTIKKFALPNVKAGTVIDVQYRIRSPFLYSQPRWYFQHKIPTDSSVYHFYLPNYISFTPVPTGVFPMNVKKDEKEALISAVNVPAYEEDDFVLDENDYRASIKYELHSVHFPNQPVKSYSENWSQIASNLYKHENLGQQLNKRLTDQKELVKLASSKSKMEAIKLLYDYVQDNIKWNKKCRIYSSDGVKRVVKEGSGNTADLSLVLANLLIESGIPADPIVLRRRYSGLLNRHYPSLTMFNYMIVGVPTEEGYFYLDPSCSHCPAGQLPTLANAYYGLPVKENSDLIDLNYSNEYSVSTSCDYSISIESPALVGTSKRRRAKYAATKYRIDLENERNDGTESEDYSSEDTQEKYIEDIDLDNHYELISINNLEDKDAPIVMEVEEKLINNIKRLGDQIFIDATLDFGLDENPFVDSTRQFPVFYNYKVDYKVVSKIKIPEGFVLEQVPETRSLTLLNKLATFRYDVKQMNDSIIIYYVFNVNRNFVLPEEYPALKRIYAMIYDLTREKIVLKAST